MPDTILIVEDEPRMGAILQDYFTAHGVDSDLAPDGDAALEYFARRDYDAVLLDVMMPGLDGYGVCRAIRRESNLPILFLTALGGEEQALHGYALGADDYVTKPFSLACSSPPKPPPSSAGAGVPRTAPWSAGKFGSNQGQCCVQ